MTTPSPLEQLTTEELEATLAQLKSEASKEGCRLFKPYAKQVDFIASTAKYRETLFSAGNQLGKFHPKTEPVLTPVGWRPIGDLLPGDEIISADGTATQVTAVYPQGVQPIFKLTFDQGEYSLAGGEHLWQVTLPAHRYPTRHSHGSWEPNPGFGRKTVVDTNHLIKQFYKNPGVAPRPKSRALVEHCATVDFPSREVPLDPYLLGVLIGDGCLRNGVSFTSADPEIVEHARAALPVGVAVAHKSKYDYAIVVPGGSAHGTGGKGGGNPITNCLREMGLHGKMAHEKAVPPSYLINSKEVRLAVLQGLMDTDGSCDKNGTIEFCSTSEQLADDVAFLVRSFGGKVRKTSRVTSYTYKGEKKQGRRSYRLWIRLPQVQPFRLARKLANMVRPVSTCDEHVLHTIEPWGEADSVCISVAHPSRLYITRDFIVTHNTLAAANALAIMLTGEYPDWWPGRRWDRPIACWVGGVTGESVRDTMQRLLMGRPGSYGTGAIPADMIIDYTAARGVADSLDTVTIKHKSGGKSTLTFKSYKDGREKWQGETLDIVAFDEEPPEDIYTEGLTRTNATGGLAWLTFTPLLGMSKVVSRFFEEESKDRALVTMTIYDVDHYTDEQRETIIAGYPAHEREARSKGIPTLGSGRIFPISEEEISIPAFPIPKHWPRLGGLDFGWDHPAAGAWLAWDRDSDSLYVYDCFRIKETTPMLQSPIINAKGKWIPMAWPHDGLQHEKGTGEQLAEQYRKHDVNMMDNRATHPPGPGQKEGEGGNSVELGITDLIERMQTGRFKVFSHLKDWFEEFRLYHRKDGKIVKLRDDLMSATRYASMMKRFAITEPRKTTSTVVRTNFGARKGGY